MNNTDYLSRQPYLVLLKSIIANQKEKPTGYSFAIDGEWGSGKTWILQELEKQLLEEKDNKYLIFHYNAWENDFYDEPLVAILSVMIEKLNEVTSQKSLYEATIDELLRQVSDDLLTLTSGIVKEITKIDIEQVIKRKKGFFKRIKENTKISSKDINTMLPLRNTLETVRKNLRKLADKVHVIFVIDELDRCLPEYAIKVLERLHHVCNDIPVIQILAINKNQISNSISKVFGNDMLNSPNQTEENIQFSEIYLQKFVDVIIPLPNGKIDVRLEVLNGLQKSYSPYIRNNMLEQEFIRVDDNFLADFVSTLMNGIERRQQEKIFKQVELCHKLTLQSGIEYDKENITYTILIYEVISCICRFVFRLSDTCKIRHEQNTNYILEFYLETNSTLAPYKFKNRKFNENLKHFFSCAPLYTEDSHGVHQLPFEIRDTKSYIMSFFAVKPKYEFVTFESHIWDWIEEDKKFLRKYDEIMNMLTMR